MILLTNSATDKLKLTTDSAATVDVAAFWVDQAAGSPPTAKDAGRTLTAISSAATTDIVPVPSSGNNRNVKTIIIKNRDASLSVTVTLKLDVNTGTSVYEFPAFILRAGESLTYIEGVGFIPLVDSSASPTLLRRLSADDTGGQAANTAQPWFPTTGTLTLPANSLYRMKGILSLTTGATTHTTGINFGGTATLNSIHFLARTVRAAAATLTATFAAIDVVAAANAVTDVTGTQAATVMEVDGIVSINAAGTFIPQFQFSASPTGTITVKKDTFFELRYLGAGSLTSLGAWS